MLIDCGGKIGIGTTSPEMKLHVVVGDAGHAAVTDFVNGVTIENSTTTGIVIATPNWAEGKIYFADPESQRGGAIIYNHPDNYFLFQTNATERLKIACGGNAIMTSADENLFPLHICNTTTGNAYGMKMHFTAAAPDNNAYSFLDARDCVAVRTIIYTDGDVWTADAGTLTSDNRLKTNIVDASDKLADIMKLKVRNFEWIPEYHPAKVGEKKIGFIAQELETVFPSLIREHDIDPGNGIDAQL